MRTMDRIEYKLRSAGEWVYGPDIQDSLPELHPSTVNNNLRSLIEAGIIESKKDQNSRRKYYRHLATSDGTGFDSICCEKAKNVNVNMSAFDYALANAWDETFDLSGYL